MKESLRFPVILLHYIHLHENDIFENMREGARCTRPCAKLTKIHWFQT